MGTEIFSLDGKHIVVVGASSGLGKATAIACAECGAIVSICARREGKLQDVVEILPNGNHGYTVVDVSDVSSINTGFDRFVEERGPISGMVYSAGTSSVRPLSVISEDYFDKLMTINLRGAMFCAKATLKNTRAIRSRASIVFLSSVNSYDTIGRGVSVYSATKAGLNGMARAIALDVSLQQHRVNTLIVGGIRTEIWDSNQTTDAQTQRLLDKCLIGPGDVSDVANGCIYLLSDASKWVTGSNLLIDGGTTLTE